MKLRRCYYWRCGERPYLFATIVTNAKVILHIAEVDTECKKNPKKFLINENTQFYLSVTHCWLAKLIKNTFFSKSKTQIVYSEIICFDFTIDNLNIEIYIVIYSL